MSCRYCTKYGIPPNILSTIIMKNSVASNLVSLKVRINLDVVEWFKATRTKYICIWNTH